MVIIFFFTLKSQIMSYRSSARLQGTSNSSSSFRMQVWIFAELLSGAATMCLQEFVVPSDREWGSQEVVSGNLSTYLGKITIIQAALLNLLVYCIPPLKHPVAVIHGMGFKQNSFGKIWKK